jgi:hypothetical protein
VSNADGAVVGVRRRHLYGNTRHSVLSVTVQVAGPDGGRGGVGVGHRIPQLGIHGLDNNWMYVLPSNTIGREYGSQNLKKIIMYRDGDHFITVYPRHLMDITTEVVSSTASRWNQTTFDIVRCLAT